MNLLNAGFSINREGEAQDIKERIRVRSPMKAELNRIQGTGGRTSPPVYKEREKERMDPHLMMGSRGSSHLILLFLSQS